MNKILSILAIWLCSIAAFAQLGSGDDWELPGNPGVATSNISVAVNDAAMGTAEVTTSTTYGAGTYPIGSTVSLVATPTTGYHFVSWSIDGSSVSTEAAYSYVMPDKNVAVTATFAPNKYSVIFEMDGVAVQTGNHDYASEVIVPADPTKEGYTFRGWNPAVDATVPAHDVTYSAVFDVNKYNVTFTIDGAEYIKSTMDFGSAITAPADVNKEGYTFGGWTTDATVPAHDVTYDATYTVNKYDVIFESDGVAVQTGRQDYASAIVAPADPAKEGYTFRGWSPAVDATVPAHDVTYSAVFDINKYNVTFTVEGEDYSKSSLEYGAAIKVPEFPTKTGYTFGGWATDETVPAHDVTYDATYTINQYNVIFESDGVAVQTGKQDYASAIVAPADPSKTGHTFNGWTPSVDGAVVPANDITFTANWKVNAYKATFVVDEVPTELSFDFGAKIVAPSDPSKEGYVFNGWSPAVAENMPAEDVTYTATWKLAKYNVTFVSDGKTVATSELEYGSAITAPANPSKEGYNFLGWNPAVDATVPAHDVTYTASFGKGAFLVSFMADGKVFATASQDFGELVALPENNPTKEGHTFAGWEGYVEGATVPAENITYNALWTANKYAVVFVSGEDVVKSETLDYGSAITLPETPSKEGYSFDGWTPAVAETVPAQDVTYSATWKVNKYNVTFEVDGKVYSTSALEYGTEIVAPATVPTKEGNTFSAWGNFVEGATVPAEDVTYKAEWTANKYVVTFVSEGDTVKSDVLDFGSALVVPAAPTKDGYSFDGWTPAVAETVPANDVTYTANFKVNQYAVVFMSEGDTIKSDNLDFGASITVPADPKKTGYTFAGWTPEVSATVPSNDVTYSATWAINKYVVTFISDGDTIQSDTLEYIAAIKAPSDPTKDGYVFTGWTPTVDDVVPSNDVTYTATWSVNKFTVAFVDGDETIKSESLEYGASIIAPAEPTKEGYTFTGWSPEVDATVPAKDVTYTATWSANKFTVAFVDGDETIKSESLEYGASIVAPADPTKDGYTFAGWSPEVSATVPAKNVTYSATWTVNKYTVSFIVDGDTVKSESLEYGASIVAPENPTKDGYDFAGWSPVVAKTMPAEDVTYTATWQVPVGIKTISLDNAPEATYYTINGVKVAKPTKAGLYIVNGVKMIIK